MRVIETDHVYALKNQGEGEQILTFIRSLPEDDPGNHDGTLIQEVLRALIDRLWGLQRQKPHERTASMIEHLRAALIDAECRAFEQTITKSYSKCGLHVEELPTQLNGHLYDCRSAG